MAKSRHSSSEVDDACLTLLAASRSDLPLANFVAATLWERLRCNARVIARASPCSDACDALVSAGSAESLGSLLFELKVARESSAHPGHARRPWVLVHPRPEHAHYALALRAGIDDIIAWPQELLRWRGSDALCGSPEDDRAAGEPSGPERELPGTSPAMDELRKQVARIAAHDANVFVVGESGSGKERVTRALHRLSRRRDKPMVVLNCAALPESLIESDLFGYERGAFTSAHAAYPGKFALADGGTLFLDEIGDMPRPVQAKILRVIEGHEYYRIGATRPVHADVRLVAATHHDLERMCELGEFRRDLYFRLNVARIDVPPLRERACDIVPLAQGILRELRGALERSALRLDADVRAVLCAYAWPGNVRELRNAIESAMIHAEGNALAVQDLPAHIVRWLERAASPLSERTLLESALQRTHWNKSSAARALKWSRMKLYRKLRQYHLDGDADDDGR